MTRVLAGITTSVDGYVTGPNDGPGKGLGEGGERLHYWVFGGPWSYRGLHKSLELEHIGVRQSPYATFIDYRVK